jgi:choline dehydrogenase-like flavoprotein
VSGDHYDMIIIGTGAGGGTLAHELTPSGRRVLMQEIAIDALHHIVYATATGIALRAARRARG